MMLTPEAIAAKNALEDGGIWLVLLDIYSSKLGINIRITNNNSNVIWNGVTYQAVPFELGEYKEGIKGEFPSLELKISNVDRTVQGYIESDDDFGSGWGVDLYIIYEPNPPSSGDVTTTRPDELHLYFETTGVTCDEVWASFGLGMENPLRIQFPHRKFIPNQCQAVFKNPDTGCVYSGADTECSYTLSDCKAKFGDGADLPFLGFPGIPTGRGVFKI